MKSIEASDTAELRQRHPHIFDKPASARLAIPAMLAVAFAIFIFGLVDLEFSPSRMLAGLNQLCLLYTSTLPTNREV